ncbi:class I SAM-dependent methyltransferase [Rhizobiales bacterium]|uniref:methyltransferase domain-containing protein n=1 Tax=Hongsoonwoonella zoysiae TaxID=2821844 RepID=UPI001561A85D|nr:class I SAM-dependent methyltransferase [Hongsoonwoonella zoysiae]NRG16339.1 class I SAM-dependent methyltransferase [Hongsoonwoonella zoysiae]
MSGFSSEWLSLRAPADARARNEDVISAFLERLPQNRPLHLVDLGSGTGATVTAFAPRIAGKQRWTLLDNDKELLEIASRRAHEYTNLEIEASVADLSRGIDAGALEQVDAVTTSAFLDLVPAKWIDDLVDTLSERRLPFLAFLTYDGRARLDPPHPFDETIRLAMNRHQKTDKGLGAALGPDAAQYALQRFIAAGFTAIAGASDWHSLKQETPFQTALLDGWANAAREIGEEEDEVNAWREERQRLLDAGSLTSTVGHIDFAAFPAKSG